MIVRMAAFRFSKSQVTLNVMIIHTQDLKLSYQSLFSITLFLYANYKTGDNMEQFLQETSKEKGKALMLGEHRRDLFRSRNHIR